VVLQNKREINNMTRTILNSWGGCLFALLIATIFSIYSGWAPASAESEAKPDHGMIIIPRRDSANAFQLLALGFGPTGFLTQSPALAASDQWAGVAGAVDSKFYSDGETSQITVYYKQQADETTPRVLIQSVFLDRPRSPGSSESLEYLSTTANYPDGTKLDCQRVGESTFIEDVWCFEQGRKINLEHSVYEFRNYLNRDLDGAGWCIASRQRWNKTGQVTCQAFYDDRGNYHWQELGHDGIWREFTADGRFVRESDFVSGHLTPFREISYQGLHTVLWLNDESGKHIVSYTYRHPLVSKSPHPILPEVRQIVRTVWADDKPVYDQLFDWDSRTKSGTDSDKPVYVFRGVAPIARVDKRYLFVRVYEGTTRVQMISVSSARRYTEANNAVCPAYPYEILPEYVEQLKNSFSEAGRGDPPVDQMVWTFHKDGSPQFVVWFNELGDLKNLTARGKELPAARQELDPNLPPDFFVKDDIPEFWVVPVNMDLELDKAQPVPADAIDACPKIDPHWLEIEDLPLEPKQQQLLPPY
jgi:hypothetical protein